MSQKKEMIEKEEAFRQVKSMINRAALIHYAFARTLVDELGEKKGKALAKKAAELYGELVGKRAKENASGRKGCPSPGKIFKMTCRVWDGRNGKR